MRINKKIIFALSSILILVSVLVFITTHYLNRKLTSGYYAITTIEYENCENLHEQSLKSAVATLQKLTYLYFNKADDTLELVTLTSSIPPKKITSVTTSNKDFNLFTSKSNQTTLEQVNTFKITGEDTFNITVQPSTEQDHAYSIQLKYTRLPNTTQVAQRIKDTLRTKNEKLVEQFSQLKHETAQYNITDFEGTLWEREHFTLKLPMNETLYPVHPSEIPNVNFTRPTLKSELFPLYYAKKANFIVAVLPLEAFIPDYERIMQQEAKRTGSLLFKEKHGAIYFDNISQKVIGMYRYVNKEDNLQIIARTIPVSKNNAQGIAQQYAQLRTIDPKYRSPETKRIDFAKIIQSDIKKESEKYRLKKNFRSDAETMSIAKHIGSATTLRRIFASYSKEYYPINDTLHVRLSLDPIPIFQQQLNSKKWKKIATGDNFAIMIKTIPYVRLRAHYYYRQHGLTAELMYLPPRKKSPLAAVDFIQQCSSGNVPRPTLPTHSQEFLKKNFGLYSHVRSFQYQKAAFGVENEKGKEGVIAKDGSVIIPCKYSSIEASQFGYYGFYSDTDEEYATFDIDGELLEDE